MSDLKVLQYQTTPITVEAIRVNKKNRGQIADLLPSGTVNIDVNHDGEEIGWSVGFTTGSGKNAKRMYVTTGWWIYRTVGRTVWNAADNELFLTRFPHALA